MNTFNFVMMIAFVFGQGNYSVLLLRGCLNFRIFRKRQIFTGNDQTLKVFKENRFRIRSEKHILYARGSVYFEENLKYLVV